MGIWVVLDLLRTECLVLSSCYARLSESFVEEACICSMGSWLIIDEKPMFIESCCSGHFQRFYKVLTPPEMRKITFLIDLAIEHHRLFYFTKHISNALQMCSSRVPNKTRDNTKPTISKHVLKLLTNLKNPKAIRMYSNQSNSNHKEYSTRHSNPRTVKSVTHVLQTNDSRSSARWLVTFNQRICES